jgi:hypothetical protein
MPTSLSHKPARRPPSGAREGSGDLGGSHGGDGDEGGGGGGGGGGDLVKVAFARNQPEAELLQGLLMDSGIPSVLKRSGGFDNPDFLAAGPHDVLVNAPAAPRAREVLAETMIGDEEEEAAGLLGGLGGARSGETSPARLALWVAAAFLGAVILVWVLYQLS